MSADEAAAHRPAIVHVDGENRLVELAHVERTPAAAAE